MKKFLFGLAAAMVVVLVWGTGVGFARGVNAAHYYEDTVSNVCVGLEETGGFGNKSCHWGELTEQTFTEDTGLGERVLEHDTTGSKDVADGYLALAEDKTGNDDTATGWDACLHISTGSNDSCTGLDAALRDTTGSENTADGVSALFANKTGNGDIGIGEDALETLTEGNSNVAIGNKAGSTIVDSSNIDISNTGEAADERTTRIGTENEKARAFVAGIYEKTVKTPACGVVVNSAGQLGCKTSAASGVSNEGSPVLLAQLQQEHAQVSSQQHEIDQLASELQSLREQIKTHR
jgi:hypothetical protein